MALDFTTVVALTSGYLLGRLRPSRRLGDWATDQVRFTGAWVRGSFGHKAVVGLVHAVTAPRTSWRIMRAAATGFGGISKRAAYRGGARAGCHLNGGRHGLWIVLSRAGGLAQWLMLCCQSPPLCSAGFGLGFEEVLVTVHIERHPREPAKSGRLGFTQGIRVDEAVRREAQQAGEELNSHVRDIRLTLGRVRILPVRGEDELHGVTSRVLSAGFV
ncbi:hypothetical protein [Streptomyces sp. NPDC007988]|uniref:hypothetical protein n=1 Tax=Streptomyces sp. NPDC007988 TaxID=3364802 RepID=UPI0036E17570